MGDWQNIQTQADLDALEREACGFHDGCIVGLEYHSGTFVKRDGSMRMSLQQEDNWLRLRLDTQLFRDETLELWFTGVRRVHLTGFAPNYDRSILSGYLAFHEDIVPGFPGRMIVWADSDWFDPAKLGEYAQGDEGNSMTYIVADGLKWRWREKEWRT